MHIMSSNVFFTTSSGARQWNCRNFEILRDRFHFNFHCRALFQPFRQLVASFHKRQMELDVSFLSSYLYTCTYIYTYTLDTYINRKKERDRDTCPQNHEVYWIIEFQSLEFHFFFGNLLLWMICACLCVCLCVHAHMCACVCEWWCL